MNIQNTSGEERKDNKEIRSKSINKCEKKKKDKFKFALLFHVLLFFNM